MTIHKKGKERDYGKKRTIAHVIVILVALVLLAIISVVAVKKSNQTEKSATKPDPESLVIEESIPEDSDSSFESDSESVKKFQDKYSMDWGICRCSVSIESGRISWWDKRRTCIYNSYNTK